MTYKLAKHPTLPPKAGYIEVEYLDGSRGYEMTEDNKIEVDKKASEQNTIKALMETVKRLETTTQDIILSDLEEIDLDDIDI